MQVKQKVTFYLSPELHRKLKIRAAIDSEPMSDLAEKAIVFYLNHPEMVEAAESATHGRTHQVYACPECATSVVVKDDEMVALKNQPGVVSEEQLTVAQVTPGGAGQEQLVTC